MRAAFLTAPLLLLLLSSADSAAAQSGAHLHIITYFCETDPGRFIGGGFGEMPEDCEYAGGITIRATDQSGTVVAECTTEPGACSLELPLSTTVTITEDVSTVPDGYTPTLNPIIVDTPPGEVAGDWIKEFINVATAESVTLPNTGTGSIAQAAQLGDELHMLAYLCDFDYEDIFVGLGGELPEDCAMAGGVRIFVTDQSGSVFSECTTDDQGACSLQVPLGEMITVTEDVSTVPEGYTTPRNPFVVETPSWGVSDLWTREFINVATADTATLPNTGAGSAEGDGGDSGLPYSAITLLLGVAAYVFWRRTSLSSRSD